LEFNIINNILNDIYTIRRILDKDYIKNTIIYSNSNILINYLFSLVKLFNFNIVKISYSKYPINKLQQLINNINFDEKYIYNISKLLDIYNFNN